MIELAFTIIRLGLAFAFFWTGVLILKDVESWAKTLNKDWIQKLLPVKNTTAMQVVAVFDIVVGLWLVSGLFLWLAALFAALHLVQVLIVTGIMGPEYRDVGLLASALGLLFYSWPF